VGPPPGARVPGLVLQRHACWPLHLCLSSLTWPGEPDPPGGSPQPGNKPGWPCLAILRHVLHVRQGTSRQVCADALAPSGLDVSRSQGVRELAHFCMPVTRPRTEEAGISAEEEGTDF